MEPLRQQEAGAWAAAGSGRKFGANTRVQSGRGDLPLLDKPRVFGAVECVAAGLQAGWRSFGGAGRRWGTGRKSAGGVSFRSKVPEEEQRCRRSPTWRLGEREWSTLRLLHAVEPAGRKPVSSERRAVVRVRVPSSTWLGELATPPDGQVRTVARCGTQEPSAREASVESDEPRGASRDAAVKPPTLTTPGRARSGRGGAESEASGPEQHARESTRAHFGAPGWPLG